MCPSGLALLAAGVDQLKTFSVVDVSVGFCWNPPFETRKPVGRLGAQHRPFSLPAGAPESRRWII